MSFAAAAKYNANYANGIQSSNPVLGQSTPVFTPCPPAEPKPILAAPKRKYVRKVPLQPRPPAEPKPPKDPNAPKRKYTFRTRTPKDPDAPKPKRTYKPKPKPIEKLLQLELANFFYEKPKPERKPRTPAPPKEPKAPKEPKEPKPAKDPNAPKRKYTKRNTDFWGNKKTTSKASPIPTETITTQPKVRRQQCRRRKPKPEPVLGDLWDGCPDDSTPVVPASPTQVFSEKPAPTANQILVQQLHLANNNITRYTPSLTLPPLSIPSDTPNEFGFHLIPPPYVERRQKPNVIPQVLSLDCEFEDLPTRHLFRKTWTEKELKEHLEEHLKEYNVNGDYAFRVKNSYIKLYNKWLYELSIGGQAPTIKRLIDKMTFCYKTVLSWEYFTPEMYWTTTEL